jgi:CO/xanthine dehydrogenase FAD-binding subunit
VRRGSQRRIAFFGVGAKPALLTPNSLEEAKASLPTPAADLYHSSSTKLHLARVLLERAWTRL